MVARMKELDSVPPRAAAGDLLGRIVYGERIAHVPDVRETEAYRDFPAARERMETLGIRTWLAVPLHKDDELRGVIVAQRGEVRPFSDRKLRYSKTSRLRRLSPWRTRGCWANCVNAPIR